MRPGQIERVEAYRVLLQAFIQVDGEWLQVLDSEKRRGRIWLWLDQIEEPKTFPKRAMIDVCYHLYPE